ncbi:TIM-barrel domain-containing protein [Nocardioides sp. JS614]|uniref:glycoside hydrolase family 31 protein n=1 Tax=unclassified Nocardioides TaxID=2615069 RepID=UPI0000570FB3|nr:glycoside hydrolase, family 31 [Nocardioides sp. JS614]
MNPADRPPVTHRPHGIEHPYVQSADQRCPVLPLAGSTCRIGVTADPAVVAVRCEWGDQVLAMTPRTVDAADAAALAGGEGHLAEAQANMLEADGAWTLETPVLVEGCRLTYRFVAVTADGVEVATPAYHVAPAVWSASHPGRLQGAADRLVPGSTSWLVSPDGVHRVRFALALRPGDHVVGFGERFDRLDQAGQRLDAVVFEQYKSQGRHGRTYLPMPFAHVVGADGESWGFHVRTSRRTWYDVGASTPEALVVEVDLGTGGDIVDVGIYDGTPTEVLTEFLDEVGRAEELPEWVLRLWASGNEWNTQRLVMDRMDRHRELDIPVGVVVIEAWSDEEGITIFRDARYEPNPDGRAHDAADFAYPPDGAWPDPHGMVDDLHSRGIKVVLWQIPLQKTDPELTGQVRMDAEAMVREGHAVLEADGSAYHNRGWWFPRALMPDLSVQRTRDWWTAKRRYLLSDLDVDGFKTDGGEHAWGHDLRYADGRRGDEGNNLFPVHYARAFGDLLRSEGKAPVTFSRAGFTGSQAHGVFWAGDEDSTWEAFRSSVTAGLTAAACGIIYWGWDLAGFSGPVPDAELYLRAAGASVFMPVMQYHSEFNHHRPPLRDRTPWNVQEASGDERVVPVFRHFARMRERLVPYLAEQARATVATDRPLMRPLFFDHPADPALWAHPLQWKLGDGMLVNPVTEPGATAWSTYLPAGQWVDAWTGTAYAGEQVVTAEELPLDRVPVYLAADAAPGLAAVFSE